MSTSSTNHNIMAARSSSDRRSMTSTDAFASDELLLKSDDAFASDELLLKSSSSSSNERNDDKDVRVLKSTNEASAAAAANKKTAIARNSKAAPPPPSRRRDDDHPAAAPPIITSIADAPQPTISAMTSTTDIISTNTTAGGGSRNTVSTMTNSRKHDNDADNVVHNMEIEPTSPENNCPLVLDIPSFTDFCDMSNPAHYRRLPPTWFVLVADVEDATTAVEQGQCKAVNLVGAACIAAVRNAIFSASNPKEVTTLDYVFGGGGASMVVPAAVTDVAVKTLLSVKVLAKRNYGLRLRVGKVLIADVEAAGFHVEMARYQVAANSYTGKEMTIPLFRGGGLALVDAIVKARGSLQPKKKSKRKSRKPSSTTLNSAPSTAMPTPLPSQPSSQTFGRRKRRQSADLDDTYYAVPDMTGLSCRWQKISNRQGCILTMLVMANPDCCPQPDCENAAANDDVMNEILDGVDRILDHTGGLDLANPVNLKAARYKTPCQMMKQEAKLHPTIWSLAFLNRAFEILIAFLIFRWGLLQNTPIIDAPHYKNSMRTHADYKKYDDMLRIVLDCSEVQADQIYRLLQEQHRNGKRVFYGLHRSKHSIMTCLLDETDGTLDGHHIHFIDGDNGGFCMAAKQLKLQLKQAADAQQGPVSEIKLNNGSKCVSIRRASLANVELEDVLRDVRQSENARKVKGELFIS